MTRRLPHSSLHETDAYSERSYFGGLIGILHPYSVLRVLGENAENREADVIWQYGPLVESGWAAESEFTPGARRRQTFLVATEGSSDAHILKHAFAILRPEIADFFRFIDVSERHPFPGTGNLLRFAEGLAKSTSRIRSCFCSTTMRKGSRPISGSRISHFRRTCAQSCCPIWMRFALFPLGGPRE